MVGAEAVMRGWEAARISTRPASGRPASVNADPVSMREASGLAAHAWQCIGDLAWHSRS